MTEQNIPEPAVRTTRYAVSCLPSDHINAHHFTIHVDWRGGGDRWAVMDGPFCLGTDGDWEWESIPSERSDEWQASHRFTLVAALELATKHAPLMTVNGLTVADVVARGAR